jgi:serine/threonine-protein kinase
MSPVRRLRTRYPSPHEIEAARAAPAAAPGAPVAPDAPEASDAVALPAAAGPAEPSFDQQPRAPAVSEAVERSAGREPPSPAAAGPMVAEPEPEPEPEPIEGPTLAGAEVEAETEPRAGTVAPAAAPRPRRRQRLAALTIALLLPVAAFAAGLMVFNSLLMPRLIHGGGEVEVPDLANLTLEQAEQVLTPLGLTLSRAGERFDPAVPRGFILSQDPGSGTPVRGRRRVSVMISLGEEFSSVPELHGESERGAFLLLKSAGLRAGGLTRAPSEDVGDGLVVATDPPAASVLPHDQPVGLLISTGAGEESYVMPQLVGRQISGARRQLEALGFRVLTPPATPSIGTIVSQSPPPGSRITRATTITMQATGRMIR